MGCDRECPRLPRQGAISIHAPQWGATIIVVLPVVPQGDFNPRTPVGCDATPASFSAIWVRFQSTHPSGVRPACAPRSRSASRISIHAPQWGATDDRSDSVDDTLFQSTHPSGVRHTDPFKGWYDTEFQSTHPSGVRLSFPPTSTLSSSISIHAPQWGATGEAEHDGLIRGISIHAPQWGATCPVPHVVPTTTFQSTHPSGVRRRPAMYFVKSVFRVGAGAVLLDSSLIPSPPIMPQDRARVDDP